MAWPSAADFSDAVQNPSVVFRDFELQNGQAELDHLGITPKPRSGGFAVVFKVQCASKNWAVKCFTRDFADQQQRYAAISAYLEQRRSPYTVGFRFLADGIRVRDRSFPILKMEWVEGETLREHVERNLHNPGALLALARRWADMIKTLRLASIAHGDLQDRNVIVVGNELRLIDYDGMFVPSLLGLSSHEIGARNYQHSFRAEKDFGPYLDNFSAWVIYLSLIALAAQPKLWRDFGGEDESLLLRRKDYDDPDRSAAFSALENSPDRHVRSTASTLRSLLYLKPEQIPSLDEPSKILSQPAMASWIEDYVPQRNNRQDGIETEDRSGAHVPAEIDLSWILESASIDTDTARCPVFLNDSSVERIVASCSIVVIALFLITWQLNVLRFWWMSFAIASLSTVDLFFLAFRYNSDEAIRNAATVTAKSIILRSQRREREETLREATLRANEMRVSQSTELAAFEQRRLTLQTEQAKDLQDVGASFATLIHGVSSRRLAASQEFSKDLAQIRQNVNINLNRIDQRMRGLDQAEPQELANALSLIQSQHTLSYIAKFSLVAAQVPGVGESFKLRLVANGFRTAADINKSVICVQGIGPTRARSLESWKTGLELRARKTMPAKISEQQVIAIRTKFQKQREALNLERARYQKQLADEEKSCRDKNHKLLDALGKEEPILRKSMTDQEDEIRARQKHQIALLNAERQNLQRRHEDASRSLDVQLSQLRKDLFSLNWQVNKIDRQMESNRKLTLKRYIVTLFTRREA